MGVAVCRAEMTRKCSRQQRRDGRRTRGGSFPLFVRGGALLEAQNLRRETVINLQNEKGN